MQDTLPVMEVRIAPAPTEGATVIVEIDLPGYSPEEVIIGMRLEPPEGWQAKGLPGHIAIDNAFLRRDDFDDEFFAFRFLGVRKMEES